MPETAKNNDKLLSNRDFATKMMPDYWEEGMAHLSRRDKKMAALVETFRDDVLSASPQPFTTLLTAIVGQQISTRAADAIWKRVEGMGPVEPSAFLDHEEEALRAAGLSRQKIAYVKSLAAFFADPTHDPVRWPRMRDEEIVKELCTIKGIGVWTAEMFMIFHLNRPDVWPVLDLGLVRALQRQYRVAEKPTKKRLMELGEKFRPYRTMATWYLWRSIDPVPVRY